MILLSALCVALYICDWLQTHLIATNPKRWYERNPILGEHPSVAKVNVYFATVAAIVVSIVTYADPLVQWLMLGGLTAAEAFWVFNNVRIGIKLWGDE